MGPETSHVHKITYGPLIDTALYVGNVFDGGKSITQAIGRDLLPSNTLHMGPLKS